MYHIVNNDSEEVEYVERRVTHLMECMASGCSISRSTVGRRRSPDHHRLAADAQCLILGEGSIVYIKIKNHRRLGNLISKRKHYGSAMSRGRIRKHS